MTKVPARFTPERVRDLVGYAGRGYHVELCAALCRISPVTLARWLELGRKELEVWEDDGAPFDPLQPRRNELGAVARFYLDFQAAQADKETAVVDMLEGAARPEDLRWILERRHPKRWSLKQSIELSGPDGSPVQVADARDSLLRGLFPSKSDGGHDGNRG